MKRFGVWTLAVLIAIMDFGCVRLSFAQSEDDFLPVPISGASGRSVRANVFLAVWTWTAPATGPVTFDTRGSDFDTLLTVYDDDAEVASNFDLNDFTLSSELGFRAQQGRVYDVIAVRFDGSFDPGTIVLNWQASSSGNGNGGGSRASADDFDSSGAISGASGRSKGSSIGAGKESGEPNHAGNDGGASVWWIWTASATGPVTFDTRGSNFDTLLAVYTGNSVDRLIEVASNDDASDGTLQSAVHFRAQQGRTYHLAVDGYGGKSGTVVLNWQATLSDGGNSGSDDFRLRASISRASGQSEGSNVGAGIESGEPNHAGNSGGASVWWTWTAPTTGSFTFHTRGSDIDTLLAVYIGDSLGNLMEVVSNDDDIEGNTLQSSVRFSAQQGQPYHIAVDGYGGATGAIVLNWQTTAPGGLEMISLSGTVVDYSTGAEIAGATVSVTQYIDGVPYDLGTTTTDDEGWYEIQVDADPGRVNIKVEAERFAPQSTIVDLIEGMDSTSADLANVPVEVVHKFRARNGAAIWNQNQDYVLVRVPANSLVTENDREPTGEVTAMVTELDASSDPDVMPGDFMTLTDTGIPAPIESFGALNLMFVDENGESLDLKAGQAARVSIPLADEIDSADAPATIPMFYWSDERGYWIEEGRATLDRGDGTYRGSIRRLATWNADKSYPSLLITGCVEDREGNSVPFAKVTAEGRDYIGRSSVTTDSNGRFAVPVRPNSEVLISAMSASGSPTNTIKMSTRNVKTLSQCLIIGGTTATTIQLSWGEYPRDVDMRLKIPTPNGAVWAHSQTPVARTVTVGGVTITVDVDDRNGYGPEIMTIPQFPYQGDYYFDVFPYRWEAGPPWPPVRVTVNLAGESHTFSADLNDTNRFLWRPFKISVGPTGQPVIVRLDEYYTCQTAPSFNCGGFGK